MREDPANRRMCPKKGCGAAIEKDGGCHHVHCVKCDAHICWKCMKTFHSGGDVYGHLGNCAANPGGRYGDEFDM